MKTFRILTLILLTATTASAQTFEWAYRLTNGQNWIYNTPADMSVDNQGNVYVTGEKYGSTYTDYATHKIGPNGNLLWSAVHSGILGYHDRAKAVDFDNQGNVYVTGYTNDTTVNFTDISTIKYSSAGNVIWLRTYNGPGSYNDEGRKIKTDNSGNIIVAGSSWGAGTETDYVILKYSSSGVLLWQARYNGPANSFDDLVDMKIHPSGDIIVTGKSQGTGTGTDYATLRLNGANGSVIWESRYNNTESGNSPDEANTLAVNSNGDVIVTGRSYSMSGTWDIFTQSYSGATGSQQWSKRYDGTASSWDDALGIAADANGNVFITGYTYLTGNQFSQTVVIKYNSSGSEIWRKFHQVNQSTTESGSAITVDAGGNPYITCFANGDPYFVNLKFNAATGNILWQDIYSTGGYTEPADIIVDAGNNIYVCGQNVQRSLTIKYSQSMTGINNNAGITGEYSLEQNYPNPFNPATLIKFTVQKNTNVKLTVYDVKGGTVKELLNESRNKGTYEVLFDASGLSSGTYFYRLDAEGFSEVKKMILIK